MVWGMIIEGIATVGSNVLQSEASKDAAEIAADAGVYGAQKSADVQRTMFDEGQEATKPWREAGSGALDQLRSAYGISDGDSGYMRSPSYNFDVEESERALRRQMNAQGMRGSGAEMLALMANRGDIASQDYGSYIGGLQSIAQQAQSPTSQTASQAYGLGQGIGDAYGLSASQTGQAQAQDIINQANLRANSLESLAGSYGAYAGGNL